MESSAVASPDSIHVHNAFGDIDATGTVAILLLIVLVLVKSRLPIMPIALVIELIRWWTRSR